MTQIIKIGTWKQKNALMEYSLDRRLRCPVGALYLKGKTEQQAKIERDKKLNAEFRSVNKEQFATHLRRNMTSAEKFLWKMLRKDQGWKAQRIIYGYIPDFVNEKRKLIIEVDGEIHDKQKSYDLMRDGHLQAKGYTVLRFTNRQVKDTLTQVLRSIRQHTGTGEIGSGHLTKPNRPKGNNTKT